MTKAIEIRGLTKSYRRGNQNIQVLHGLDLQVAAGEFVAFMGPSGSGKTTLLNLIAGLDRPSSGEIVIGGDRIDTMEKGALAAWRSCNLGFIFQFYNLLPVLNAERNVEVPLLLTELSAAQRHKRVSTALQLVGLAERAKHKPSELSGGQQQRVSIARAIVADPAILVCDEPTGDLDRDGAQNVLVLLQQLNRTYGKTILMVTHDPLAANHATRQVQLDKGRLNEGGTMAA